MTCLRCGGPLIPVYHWHVCPKCSKDWLATLERKDVAVVRRPDPELLKHVPDRRQGGGF